MRLWQLVWLASLLDCKPSRAITTLQILESVDGNTRCTRGELQQTRLLFRVPAANALPEILDNFVILGVTTVVGVLLPVIHVDVCYTTDKQLEFTFVEDVDEVGRDQLVETSDEGLELFLDALLDTPFCDQSSVVVSIFI